MDNLKDVQQRQSVTNSPNQTGVGQGLANAARFGQPSQRAQDVAARDTEIRCLWYVRLIVNKQSSYLATNSPKALGCGRETR